MKSFNSYQKQLEFQKLILNHQLNDIVITPFPYRFRLTVTACSLITTQTYLPTYVQIFNATNILALIPSLFPNLPLTLILTLTTTANLTLISIPTLNPNLSTIPDLSLILKVKLAPHLMNVLVLIKIPT